MLHWGLWSFEPNGHSARAMLMGTQDHAVGHCVLIIDISSQKGKDPLLDVVFGPTVEPLVNIKRFTKTFRRVTPQDTRPVTIQYASTKSR